MFRSAVIRLLANEHAIAPPLASYAGELIFVEMEISVPLSAVFEDNEPIVIVGAFVVLEQILTCPAELLDAFVPMLISPSVCKIPMLRFPVVRFPPNEHAVPTALES